MILLISVHQQLHAHYAYKAHSALATQHSATTDHQAALRSLHADSAKQSTHQQQNTVLVHDTKRQQYLIVEQAHASVAPMLKPFSYDSHCFRVSVRPL
jgi:hypothetical protein